MRSCSLKQHQRTQGSSSNIMIDISDYIDTCASTLNEEDPMFFDPSMFSLFDSMAAIELMDPSMDCCEQQQQQHAVQEENAIITAHPKQLPWRDLTYSQVKLISLELLLRLVSFLDGSNVAESIFTCLYAQEDIMDQIISISAPLSPPQTCLLALLVGILRLSDSLRSIVEQADIYEEEDFNLQTFGFTFQRQQITNPQAIRLLTQAVLRINDSKSGIMGEKDNIGTDLEILSHVLQSILYMLQYCHYLLENNGNNDNENLSTLEEESNAFAKKSVHALQHIHNYLLAEEVKSSQVDEDEDQQKNFLLRCFDPNVNRRLMGSTPARKVSNYKKSYVEAIAVLLQLCNDIALIVCQYPHNNTVRQTYYTFHRISLCCNCNIVVRSILAITLVASIAAKYHHLDNTAPSTLSNWILQDMRQLLCSNEGGLDHPIFALLEQSQSASLTDSHSTATANPLQHENPSQEQHEDKDEESLSSLLLHRLGKSIYDSIKLLLVSRCRQRAVLSDYFHSWSVNQNDANSVDYYYSCRPSDDNTKNYSIMANLVLLPTLSLMEDYIGLSIDTGLVHEPYDLVISYWYWSYLFSAHVTVRDTLYLVQQQFQKQQRQQHSFTTSSSAYHAPNRITTKSKKKNRKTNTTKQDHQIQQQLQSHQTSALPSMDIEIELEYLVLGAMRYITKGIFQVCAMIFSRVTSL
jgi:hypothetical protein